MFAIIKTGGKQYRVQEGDVLSVERLPAGTGKTALFDQVLLIADDKETLIGTPFIEKAAVRAAVIKDFKGDKVLVFKKKRRKQFRRTRGHRQELTRVKILNIVSDAALLPPEEIEEPEAQPPTAPPEAEKIEEAAAPKPAKKEAKPKEKAAAAKPEKEKKPPSPRRRRRPRSPPRRGVSKGDPSWLIRNQAEARETGGTAAASGWASSGSAASRSGGFDPRPSAGHARQARAQRQPRQGRYAFCPDRRNRPFRG